MSSNKNIKLGTVTTKLQDGGAERVVSTLSMNFSKDVDQHFCFFRDIPIEYDFIGKHITLGIEPSTSIVNKGTRFLKKIKKIKEWKKKNGFDVCISHLPGPNLINLLSKQNEKTVIVVHSTPSKLYEKKIIPFVKMFYSRADKIVAVSNDIKKDLVLNLGIQANKIQTIYNPLAIDKVVELKDEAFNEEEASYFQGPTLIYVGRISPEKAQWFGIRALAKLKKTIPNLKLVILGKGNKENEDYLYNLVMDLDLQDSVHFLGFQLNPFKYLSKADVFLMTSLTEGMPVSVLEAFACETKVVACNCSGIKDLLEPSIDQITKPILAKHGYILPIMDDVRPNAEDAYSEKEQILIAVIEKALSSNMGKEVNLAAKFAQSFSAKKITEEYVGLFQHLIK